MLGRTPKLDVGAFQRKMIFGGRGGYCLEQNMLFRAGLRSLGYQITSLQGRVVRGMAIDAPRPAIHMLLRVELAEGPYLADVGFGNLAPTSALLLRPGIEQETPHEPMRFIDVGGELTLQAKLRDTRRSVDSRGSFPGQSGHRLPVAHRDLEMSTRSSLAMSALGHKRTLVPAHAMSALPPKADIGTQSRNVRFVPKADIGRLIRSRRRAHVPAGSVLPAAVSGSLWAMP
jgi:N-acetyltransferase